LLLLAFASGGALYVGHINAEVANQGFKRWRDVIHAFFFFTFLLACSWSLVSARLTVPSLRPLLPILAVILVAFDLFSVTADRQFAVRPTDFAYRQPLVVQRVLDTIGDGKLADRDILSGNHGLLYGLPSVTSTVPLRLTTLATARQRLPEARLFDLLNVTQLIAQRDDARLRDP